MGNCRSISTSSTNRKLTLAIVGLDNAGKTVTTKGLLGEAVETVTPTIGFSSVSFQFEKHDVTLFDLGGGKNIRGIWKKYFAEVYGLIYVVDSSAVLRLRECRDVLEKLIQEEMVKGKPLLLLVNKQDLRGAMEEADVCEQLHLEPLVNKYKTPCHVQSCSAIQYVRKTKRADKKLDDSIQIGLRWLISKIDAHWLELSKRVEIDVGRKLKEEKREKEERTERVRRNRELREKDDSSSESLRNRDYDNYNEIGGKNPFRPIKQQLLTSERRESSLKSGTPFKQPSDDKFRREFSLSRGIDMPDSGLYSSGRSQLARRKSIDDDLYHYSGSQARERRLQPLDNDPYRSKQSNDRKLKSYDDDVFDPYASKSSLKRPQLGSVSKTYDRKSTRDDSDRDSDDDRQISRNGYRSTNRALTPPLAHQRYGSLEGLNGRDSYQRGSSLAPISRDSDSYLKNKPRNNQTAPLDTPRYSSSYDSKPPPYTSSHAKTSGGINRTSQPSRLGRLEEREDSTFARKWNLLDDLPDSEDDYLGRPKSRGPVRSSKQSGSYYNENLR